MSDEQGINKIRPDEPSPPDQPDQKTKDEGLAIKKRSLTATERESEAHHDYQDFLKDTIERVLGEKTEVQGQAASLQQQLDDKDQKVTQLSVRCERAEVSGGLIGAMKAVGGFFSFIGAIVVSVAGVGTLIEDKHKLLCCGAGIGLALCGGLLILLGFACDLWIKWRR